MRPPSPEPYRKAMKEKGMLNTLLRPDTGTKRLRYLDNLRSLVIFFVAVMHSDVTYSGVGGWYYTEDNPASLDMRSRVPGLRAVLKSANCGIGLKSFKRNMEISK